MSGVILKTCTSHKEKHGTQVCALKSTSPLGCGGTDAHAVVDMDSDDDADDFDEGEDVDWGGIDLDAIEAMVAAEAAKPAC